MSTASSASLASAQLASVLALPQATRYEGLVRRGLGEGKPVWLAAVRRIALARTMFLTPDLETQLLKLIEDLPAGCLEASSYEGVPDGLWVWLAAGRARTPSGPAVLARATWLAQRHQVREALGKAWEEERVWTAAMAWRHHGTGLRLSQLPRLTHAWDNELRYALRQVQIGDHTWTPRVWTLWDTHSLSALTLPLRSLSAGLLQKVRMYPQPWLHDPTHHPVAWNLIEHQALRWAKAKPRLPEFAGLLERVLDDLLDRGFCVPPASAQRVFPVWPARDTCGYDHLKIQTLLGATQGSTARPAVRRRL